MSSELLIKNVLKRAKQIEGKIIKYRRELHKIPEPGFQEHFTTEFISQKLKETGLIVEENIYQRDEIEKELRLLGEGIVPEQGSTGVVGILDGAQDGKTVLLRADIDALLIKESEEKDHNPNKEGFRSVHKGIMHACGHDAHIAMLLGAAEILAELQDRLPGRIKFLFQPDEERGCGAKLMCQAGVLTDVDAVYGLHIWTSLPSGKIMINYGPVMAAVDNFWININGGGGHSSMPYKFGDPVIASTDLINQIYRINTRNLDILNPALISIERIESKADWGVIPDKAELRGTIRTFDSEVRDLIVEKIRAVGNEVGSLHGLAIDFKYLDVFPPVINSRVETDFARECTTMLFGEENIFTGKPVMSGEDFAYYLAEKPGTFIFLGAGYRGNNRDFPHHSPNFDIDESVLYKGAALYAALAIKFIYESRTE